LARKILLADDSVTAQNMGRKILADAGYEVIAVNNGSAALKKIAETKPDIIILDVYMPGYSGLEVCQRLKEAQETSRIPVLLTVGKLEPFKPEEAKRVRAEGYIVKPFEASELLSTLSKLEDKIVPRAEPSKPGRFARANAAIDEGRYDKAVQTEEDSGWKNRIGFPSKNKKVAQDDGDDSAIYNAVNKDLRTVIDRKQANEAQEAKAEESRFDLGALAPEGLPKDVTPEEIAALAAAAAQVKGKLGESAFADAVPEQPAATATEAKVVEAKTTEGKPEANTEIPPVAEAPKESPAATFAEQKSEEQVEAPTTKSFEAVKEGMSAPSATEMMAAIAGLVPEAGKSTDSSSGNGFGSHGAPEHHAPAGEPVTMAAAAGAGAGTAFGEAASRWTAVAVALAPEESAISLEHEMQKAHAAFAAAEVAHTSFVAPIPEIQPSAVEPTQISSPLPASVITPVIPPEVEAVVPAPAAPLPDLPRDLPGDVPRDLQRDVQPDLPRTEVAQSATPAVSVPAEPPVAAVKEFERVAASYAEPQPAVQPAPVQTVEPVPQSVPEAAQAVEARAEAKFEDSPVVEAPASQPEAAKPEIAKDASDAARAEWEYEDRKHEDQKQEAAAHDQSRHDEPIPVTALAPAAIEEASVISSEKPEASALAAVKEAPVNEVPASEAPASGASAIQVPGYQSFAREAQASQAAAVDQISASPGSSDIAAPQPAVASTKDIAKKESEITETTAAAWASWRRIRESGDAKAAPSQSAKPTADVAPEPPPAPAPLDEAAMAVAAGAEKSPDEAPTAPEDSPDIANMVDSVLAGLRPQIVEEISRKLGKKK
jgi:two-component system, OmpR family, phosphate regulon response regulator PhoB